jgi:predicted nucleic acid-binding Zn ribbon protein
MRERARSARIGNLLPGVLGELGLGDTLRATDVLEAWRLVVGEKLAGFAQATSFQAGILTVEAVSPVWLSEIRFHQVRIRKSLEERCGAGVVRELRLVLASPRKGESTWR